MGAFHAHGHAHVHRFDGLAAAGWLERLDPRARVLGFGALAMAAAATRSSEGAGLGLWAALAFVLAGGLPIAFVASRLAPLALLLVPVALLVPWSRLPGAEPLVAGWPGGPTDLGAEAALRVAMRVVAVSLLALLAVGVGAFDRTVQALESLGVPRRLGRLVLLTYRYLACLREEWDRVERALAARGFRARVDRRTLAVLGQAVGGLFVRALRRAERVEAAMRSRGFTGRPVLSVAPPLAARSLVQAALLVAAAALLVAADRGLLGSLSSTA